MTVLLIFYLAVGVVNAVVAWNQGLLMIDELENRFEGIFEVVLYVLLWPLQVLFFVGCRVVWAVSWAVEKFWEWASDRTTS